ncbi:pyridoxamine 5'-phosphate oxidase family protein [Streptomyces sp. NPDC087420]|uniref:pyridoxamine 5'-phosphate oxidase family protein n=1 Tax=Streptomyces sp. NPDC087420 TaxID=3365785 RepID=UPI003836959C
MVTADDLAERAKRVLDTARYMNLATASAGGVPWAATLEYAWLADPLRFVFGSATSSRHSRHVRARPEVGGSLFIAGRHSAGVDIASVDGAQFSGHCTEIAPDKLDEYYARFYETVFPDPRQRARWQLRPTLLRSPAEHRLYLVEVERWWLIDTGTWAEDRIDRRVELPLDMPALTGPSRRTHARADS